MPTLSERLGVNSTTVHASSRIAKALASAGVAKTPELLRILGLPRRIFDENAYPDASVLYAKGACTKQGCQYCKLGAPALKAIQSAMVIEAAQNNGAMINAGIGKGKTLASFLMHPALGAQRTVLLVPAQLRNKTLATDYPALAAHFELPLAYRAEDFRPGMTGVFVIGYEELSDTGSSDLLDTIRPDLIVADEAHKLRNPKAARTRRFLRFMRKNPCRFVMMTGSAMSKVITDFSHLVELALGKNSPVPRDYPSLKQWSDCIDLETTAIGALALFCEDHESAREGFQRRLRETPGVIVTVDPSCDVPIHMRHFLVTPPAPVQQALAELEDRWAWDGEEYDQTLEIIRVQRQLAQGFFYRAVWPGGNADRQWLERRNAWRRAVRLRLGHTNRSGQDSPALLEALAESGQWTPPEWVDWLEVRDRPEPDRETVEISRYLVQLCKNWLASSPDPGIIWVDSPVIGQWLSEAGITFFGDGEDAAVDALATRNLENPSLTQSIALSMRSHGIGKNLQAWYRNLVLYPPASNDVWEQMVGRTHRPGQEADHVEFDVVVACDSAQTAIDNAFGVYAKRVEANMGQPQRLNLCEMREPDDRLGSFQR